MTAIEKYKIDIVKRTKEILDENYKSFEEKDREVTLLLNCLLGLIVAISENEKRKKKVFKDNIDDYFLSLIPDKVGFVESNRVGDDLTDANIKQLNVKVGHKEDLKGKSQLWFINRIRNGIAHQNIEGINENDKWIGVRLWNTNASIKDFEIIFTIEELKNLATTLSGKYLNEENT